MYGMGMPGMGMYGNSLIGGVIGGIVMESFGARGVTGLNAWSLLVAFFGAAILLLLMRLLGAGVRGS